jgi:hypothetical protein
MMLKFYNYDIVATVLLANNLKITMETAKMCNKTCGKIAATIIIILALALAIIVTVWQQKGLTLVAYVSRFFDVMLPVLAVGALMKYLVCGGRKGCCSSSQQSESGCCNSSQQAESGCCKKD